MIRPICALVLLFANCAILAAPVPEPFKTSWGKPIDPSHDCKFVIKDGKLAIELPGTYYDISTTYDRYNAPRLLRDVEGDFIAQVRVRGSFHPSTKSNAEGQAPSVAAGLVLQLADKRFIRHEYRVVHHLGEMKTYAFWREVCPQSPDSFMEWRPDWKNWPQGTELEHFYLRMEKRDGSLRLWINLEDKDWETKHGGISLRTSEWPAKLKVGLAAYSTSTEPFKPTFDQFKLIRLPKKKK